MKVLFICKGNSFRSQIAEAIFNRITQSDNASSAGTYPGSPDEPEGSLLSTINKSDDFVQMMLEKGFDLKNKRTVRLTPEMLKEADVVISMAEEQYQPEFLKNHPSVFWWNVSDVPFDTPRNQLRAEMEKTYATIEDLVVKLIADLQSQT